MVSLVCLSPDRATISVQVSPPGVSLGSLSIGTICIHLPVVLVSLGSLAHVVHVRLIPDLSRRSSHDAVRTMLSLPMVSMTMSAPVSYGNAAPSVATTDVHAGSAPAIGIRILPVGCVGRIQFRRPASPAATVVVVALLRQPVLTRPVRWTKVVCHVVAAAAAPAVLPLVLLLHHLLVPQELLLLLVLVLLLLLLLLQQLLLNLLGVLIHLVRHIRVRVGAPTPAGVARRR